ncbi:MAG: Rrf2 family transcriptional regulator [Solirubrobacteraceae bacterium MAG38_C4-C5]|nr:Rrf2 family transcriptional regulator [Candidatus Siliceabacter maunaloa]
MTDFLDDKKREINDRLKELKPLVDEYQRLVAAKAALDGVGAESATPRRSRRAAASSGASGNGRRRRGRPRGSGTRATQALDLVKANPGISIPEIAEKMDIQQNYLYRVLPGLAQDGLVEKQGRGWHPKEAA